jgi:CRP/FNR family transcriptional regulator
VALRIAGLRHPYERSRLSREFSDLQRQFHKIMSREIVRDHGVMLLLGSMRAEERLAAFLLNLTQQRALLTVAKRHDA